ncbi:hypothetical protein [Hydrococcus rivularis]|uniref:hypothetical protein n=1 Tax=Hydrococcus rivularis TaxID=1616834 RepID=UPI000AE51432|nr:hypothetical protein [Hydrococcus rivularis]
MKNSEKFSNFRTPLDLILRNPRLTPIILFVFAVVPFVTLALIMAILFLDLPAG